MKRKKAQIELFFLVLNCPNADRFFRNWEVPPSVFINSYSIRAVSKDVMEGLSSPITSLPERVHPIQLGSSK